MKTYQLLGVGFGPAAISLATLFEEETNIETNFHKNVKFFEKNENPSWHSQFLLPGTSINHHYLTDLVTPRNPLSRFSFINYLHEKERFYQFCYLDNLISRAEWSDYIVWVAKKLDNFVEYSQEITNIEYDKICKNFVVYSKDNSYLSKNLFIATGLYPNIPEIFQNINSDKIFHSSTFLSSIQKLKTDFVTDKNKRPTFLVVGSGQSAIEAINFIKNNFSDAIIYSTHRSVGFKLKDTGHTSNAIYFPEETDYFYHLDSTAKDKAFQDMKSADYGNVSRVTSHQFYWNMYEEVVRSGETNIKIINRKTPIKIRKIGDKMEVTFKDVYKEEYDTIDVNSIILCTGYSQEKIPRTLQSLEHELVISEDGRVVVNRDYSLQTKNNIGNIYISGMSETTHGISDTQSFSIMAIKALYIFNSMLIKIFSTKERNGLEKKLTKSNFEIT